MYKLVQKEKNGHIYKEYIQKSMNTENFDPAIEHPASLPVNSCNCSTNIFIFMFMLIFILICVCIFLYTRKKSRR